MEVSPMEGHRKFSQSEERVAFLSGAPQSGELTPFAQKIAAEMFVLLCSIVVFGSTANYASDQNELSALSRFHIAAGVVSTLFSLPVVVLQFAVIFNRVDSTWASPVHEQRLMIFLIIWWIFGVSCLSAISKSHPDHAPGIAIFFGWLAFFGSIFGAYKAYHAAKEDERSLHHAKVMSMKAAEDEPYANLS